MVSWAAPARVSAALLHPASQRADFLGLGGAVCWSPAPRLGPRPDRSVDQTDHCLAFNIHRNHRMDEEARRRPVRRRSEPTALLVPVGEVDLRRILHHQDAPSHTALRRPSRQCLDDPLDRDIGRGQEAVDRHLARPRLPQPAQHRRPRRRDPPKQPFCPLVDPDIAK